MIIIDKNNDKKNSNLWFWGSPVLRNPLYGEHRFKAFWNSNATESPQVFMGARWTCSNKYSQTSES